MIQQIIRKAASLLFTEKCMKEYFEKFNFLHGECFKATLSKGLGLGIIAGSFLVKVPQIVKIIKSKSGEGINVFSVLLDLFAITAMSSYSFMNGFPFSAWGDGVFLGFQTVAIAVLVMHYNGETTKATAFLSAYLAVIFAANSGLTPIHVLWTCQAMNIPIILVSKFIQAYTNYSNGNTGQLSAITCFLLFFGSLARIFTSIQETGDASMIIMYTCSTVANAVIVLQLLYYWNVQQEKTIKKKK
ncbi:mannose-P-dolichol utilization defect 1 protein homolog [Pseudomyrmex gracilis]|uniref:mannose-P-dolichol utilization defect 1 protein homolog n=1 Tax=Pseudomyrmex gracilis TaxID=219809 RepID=UPI0009949468|nr:mannose-P-dolichol utilization defect 1 protein homolog [Pseudomyrmex gracilis]XP_020295818.1 mannose-P-dolichol utilization defect 1 protein homolog [Pseudomyrmex gracilis]XP_020295819.1 mannose-P-dolichol utilization defect 1 protein homolog [Pseudomyrmex gracilis]XP_020295820.1 mannose-P-dolichol utilization defect 1 protein homolog [Pseudomyrmex gracilis]XP_020295821.1 mannose-P-dolichol utilization defect 1 protein homolog [Pseudomyrmex gracilis]